MQIDKTLKRVITEVIEEIREEHNYELDFDVAVKLIHYMNETFKYGISNMLKIKIPCLGTLNPAVYKRFEHSIQSLKVKHRELYNKELELKREIQEIVPVRLNSGLVLMLPTKKKLNGLI
jgi:hypothetical protein